MRPAYTQLDFERAVEERIAQVKKELRDQILYEDNEAQIRELAQIIANRAHEPCLERGRQREALISELRDRIQYLELPIDEKQKSLAYSSVD